MPVKKEGSSPLGFSIGIVALFLAGFILLVVFGAQSYRDTVSGQNDNMILRSKGLKYHACMIFYDLYDRKTRTT